MRMIAAYIRLTRPLNLLIGFFSIFVGGFITGSIHPVVKLLLACISGVCIAAGANVINDYYDIDIDRINKPDRPLPSGQISRSSASRFALLLFFTGIGLSVFIHLTALLITLSVSALLIFYSYAGKRIFLVKNLIVSFSVGAAFLYGGMAVGSVLNAMIVGLFAFLYHLAREIIKDIEDQEGDRTLGIPTWPVKYGIDHARTRVSVILGLLIFLMLVPFFLRIFSWRYMVTIILGVDTLLVYVLYSMWKKPEKDNLARLSLWMKYDMFIALLAIYLGH